MSFEDVYWDLGVAVIVTALAYTAYAIFRARRDADSSAKNPAPGKMICCAHSSWCAIHYASNHGTLANCTCGVGGSAAGHAMRL